MKYSTRSAATFTLMGRCSGFFDTWSYDHMKLDQPLSMDTLVSAAVSVVLPWPTSPIVPTLQRGLSGIRSGEVAIRSVSLRDKSYHRCDGQQLRPTSALVCSRCFAWKNSSVATG